MANSQIGALRVALSLDSAQFSTGIKTAQTGLARFNAAARGFGAGIASALLPIAASFLSISAAVGGAREAMDAFGKVADAAARTGLDPEFLQGIGYAASLAGVSFDQMAGALQTFAKNSGQADIGTGRLAAALKKLNPELLASIQGAKTQEERFRLVVDALSKIEDPAKRATIAVAAFGEAGAGIAAAFAGGAAQIDATIVKARELGIIVDREVIERADALGDEFDTVSQVLDIKVKQALVNLGPILVGLTGAAADFAGVIGSIFEGMKALDQQTTRNIEDQYNALSKAGTEMPNPFGLPTDVFGVDAAKKAELLGELRRRAMDRLRNDLTFKPINIDIGGTLVDPETLPKIESVADGIRGVGLAMDSVTPKVEAMDEKFGKLADTLSDALGGMVGGLVDAFDDLQITAQEAIDVVIGGLKDLGKELLNEGLRQGIKMLFSVLGNSFNVGGGPIRPGFNLPGFAAGTMSAPRGLALIGENGPELVNFKGGEQVYPNGTGPGGVTQIFHITGSKEDAAANARAVRVAAWEAVRDFNKNPYRQPT